MFSEKYLEKYRCTPQLAPGGGHSLVSSAPMRDQKNDEKGYFFQEGQCAALTSFRVGKMSFLWKKGMFFTILLKLCEKGWTEASLADMFWPK